MTYQAKDYSNLIGVDYGLKRADYIAAFFKNIKWDVVAGRVQP
jgi:superoxide dismutase